jgi:hypothetical protein
LPAFSWQAFQAIYEQVGCELDAAVLSVREHRPFHRRPVLTTLAFPTVMAGVGQASGIDPKRQGQR